VVTDRLPSGAAKRREFERSDATLRLLLPAADAVQPLARALAESMDAGEATVVAGAATRLLTALAEFYGVPVPDLKVLGVRPHRLTEGVCTYQLFGDYTPSTQRIRVWMRTAVREKVASPKAVLNVLLHEFCHHLDVKHLQCPESFHTRGFYSRIDGLYHHVLGTPPAARKPQRWLNRVGVSAIHRRQFRRS
jgi:hypothetical protein